jgi:hypothetical protein
MKQYSIQFEFKGRQYTADVTEIDGLDNVQYAMSPRDEALGIEFKTKIIRQDKDDQEWHYDIPLKASGEEYMESLLKGLRIFLKV